VFLEKNFMTVALEEPISRIGSVWNFMKDIPISEVRIKNVIRVCDIKGINFSDEASAAENMAFLLSRVTDLNIKEVESLSVIDFSNIVEIVNGKILKKDSN